MSGNPFTVGSKAYEIIKVHKKPLIVEVLSHEVLEVKGIDIVIDDDGEDQTAHHILFSTSKDTAVTDLVTRLYIEAETLSGQAKVLRDKACKIRTEHPLIVEYIAEDDFDL